MRHSPTSLSLTPAACCCLPVKKFRQVRANKGKCQGGGSNGCAKKTQTIALVVREKSCQSNALMTDRQRETHVSLDKVALAFSRQKTKQMSGKDTSLALYLSLSLSLSLSLTLVSPSLIAFVRAHSLSCCPFGLISVLSALSFHQEIPRNHRV